MADYDYDGLLENLIDMQKIIEGTQAMDEANYSEDYLRRNIVEDMEEVFRLLTLSLPVVEDIIKDNAEKLKFAGRTKEDLVKEIELMTPVVEAAIEFKDTHPQGDSGGKTPFGCNFICEQALKYEEEIAKVRSKS